jgi:CheY-like chemotaxis protein
MDAEMKMDLPILVVEDSMPDYKSILRAFRKVGLESPVYHCETGEDALDFIYRRNAYADAAAAPRPGIILLDLNLPGTDGRGVLKQLKNDNNFKDIPVVIFTTSTSTKDIEESYNNGANSYIPKPVNIEKLYEAIGLFKKYWLETALIPGTLN